MIEPQENIINIKKDNELNNIAYHDDYVGEELVFHNENKHIFIKFFENGATKVGD